MSIKRLHIAISVPVFADFKNLREQLKTTLPVGVKISADYVMMELIKTYREKHGGGSSGCENSV